MLPNNLYSPVAGDQGVRGIFSDEAYSASPQVWYIRNRGLARGIAAALVGVGAAVALASRRR